VVQLRNAVKAIIIQSGRLLTIKYTDPDGAWFSLPGGGQEAGETLHQALQRECLEELGIKIEIGPLRYIREYIGVNHEFADHDSEAHQVEFIFNCSISTPLPEMNMLKPDPGQVGISWLPVDELTTCRLYPKFIRALLQAAPEFSGPVYLGDVN
jgi:ADP-ribose pyrophosphatase YjhB (NUDIX family)